ncbi:MAG: translation elongation factor Ts [Bacillota bacterium]|nr:translation elongation factor Ts [Bacillota bacterium]
MAFTAKDVVTLRERTGVGMMDCKKALTQADGDLEKAVEILREKGLAAAAKKASRIAAEGLVACYTDDAKKVGVVIEVNSETDFVAKNADFQGFVAGCAKTVADTNPADVDALLETNYEGGSSKVADVLRDKILTIGENLKVRRFERYEGITETYIHGGGRIGVMVKFDTTDEAAGTEKFKEFAKDIAMQVAASNPSYNKREEVPAEVLDKEKEILKVQAINEGKPEAIAEKMVAGRVQKFYKENCLIEQVYIKNNDMSVKQYMDSVSKEIGAPISIAKFARFEKGEGLQKREDDFAAEVAKMVK